MASGNAGLSLTWLFQLPWDWEPSIVAGCAGVALFYLGMSRYIPAPGHGRRLRALAFILGDAVLLFALCSPIDTLADHYLFSAHMVQHLLLIEIAAPLFLLSVPGEWWRRWLRNTRVAAIERPLRHPLLAWMIGFGAVAFWHLPLLYNLTMRSEPIHIGEHLCFLITAVVFWWPVLSPMDASRMAALDSIVYLFARMVANLILGTIVALIPVGVYAVYAHALPAPIPWHLTPLNDQHLGGYLMWVPTLGVDMAAVPLLLALWFGHLEDTKSAAAERLPAITDP